MTKRASKSSSQRKSMLQAAIFAGLDFMCCFLCTATPEISSSSQNISNTGRVIRLSSLFSDYDANRLVANRFSAIGVFKQVISSKIKREGFGKVVFDTRYFFSVSQSKCFAKNVFVVSRLSIRLCGDLIGL